MTSSPQGGLLLGNLNQVRKDPLGFFSMCAREHGDFVPLRFGPKRGVFLNNPDYIAYIMDEHPDKFVKGPGANAMKVVFGNGLLLSEGKVWQRQHDMALPAQDEKHVRSHVTIMVDFASRMIGSWSDGQPIDIHGEMMLLALQQMAKIFFDVDITQDVNKEFGEALGQLQERAAATLDNLLLPAPQSLPTARNRRLGKVMRRFDDMLYELIKQRQVDGKDHGDFLSVMLAARDQGGKPMSHKQLRDDIVTIILSTETIPLTLMYAVYLLSTHANIQQPVAEEVDKVIGDRAPSVADQESLPLVQKVIMETLRLYPPIYATDRIALENLDIDGHRVDKGTTLFSCQWVMHRDPRFYEDPEGFRPSRWTPEFMRGLPKYAYFPYGAGPRRCYGEPLGISGTLVGLATLIQACRFTLVPGETLDIKPELIIRPKHPIMVTVNKRHSA